MGGLCLWVDDLRPAPEGWHHAKSFDEAIKVILGEDVDEISLDHDLGDTQVPERTGYTIVVLLAERVASGLPIPRRIHVHSANPVGRERIIGVIRRYMPGTWQSQ